MYAGQEAVITIDSSQAGPGRVHCIIEQPNGENLSNDVVENRPHVHDVFFTPQITGPHNINLYYGGAHVPKSPYVVKVCQCFKLPESNLSIFCDIVSIGIITFIWLS